MPFEYHVTCKESQSKKKVAAESKAGLIAAIQHRFDVQYDILVQQPYEDDWLDVDDLNDLNESGKLRFIRKANSVIPTTPVCDEVIEAPTTPKGFGLYVLPKLPQDLVQCLAVGGSNVATSRRDRARIMQVLYDDLRARVGLYASNQEVKTVCHTLVMTYPCLEDRIKIGQNTTRYSTWYESLRQKMKDSRRNLTSDEQVLQMKSKYGGRAHARRRGDPLDLSETPKTKTPRLDLLQVEDGEDERSVQQHIAVIQQQWGKASCDVGIISDRMLRTYAARREMVQSGAKLVDILIKYPSLKDQAQLQMEFFRMTRVNLLQCLQEFWTTNRVDIALRKLTSDRSVQDIVAGVGDSNVIDEKLKVIMRVLPRLFGEGLLCWTQTSTNGDGENVEGLTVYPTFVVGSEVSVYFERTHICKCPSVLVAAITVFMLYYVFDVQFPSELANTCNFLDSCVGRLDAKRKIRPAVQRQLNLLLAA